MIHAQQREAIRVAVIHADPIAEAGLSVAFGRHSDLAVLDGPDPTADVVVADYSNALSLASARNGRAPAKVMVVGGTDREWDIRRALEKGVRGYLLAGSSIDELAEGVRAVHRGARHLSPQAAARLAESVYFERLTAREEDVLRLLTDGLPNKTIASRLGISEGTVKSHLKATFDKLNVQSRTQAVALVERRGLLAAA